MIYNADNKMHEKYYYFDIECIIIFNFEKSYPLQYIKYLSFALTVTFTKCTRPNYSTIIPTLPVRNEVNTPFLIMKKNLKTNQE